jgi:DNA modification methylase
MQEFGWTNPILVAEDNMVVAGHARLQVATELGFTEVPVIKLDMPYEKAVAYVIADNRLAELAETDNILMEELLSEVIKIPDFDFEATGYSMDDLDALINEVSPKEIVEDVAPGVPDVPVTVRGDVWELGKHRLMCGDSTCKDDVDVLMDGVKADMVFTDPPWNVGYVGKTDDAMTIQNDSMATDDFKEFMMDSFSCMREHSCSGAMTYVVMSAQEWGNMMLALKDNGYHWSSTIIWNKNSMVLSRKDYHTKYEPIWYGWSEGSSRICPLDDRTQTDVWDIDKPNASVDHPTTKPVELIVKALNNSSKHGNNVLDLFGGSGSTLIACEQTNRINYSMELDEHYCDVIIQRYVNFTGNTELTRNGEPYTWQKQADQ